MRNLSRFIDTLCMSFLAIALILLVYTLPNSRISTIEFETFLDLIVNNGTNIFIAIYISGYIVRKYDSRQHSLDFLIDLLRQSNDLCEVLLSYSYNDFCRDKSKYLRQVNLFIEYSEAILTQLSRCCKKKGAIKKANEMIFHSKSLYVRINQINSSNYNDVIESVISLQTRIPQIMSKIKY